jgi:hypothetical protein
MLERQGAVVERLGPDELEVLAPEAVQKSMGWPELARLGFGRARSDETIRIGLEGDWLDRFGALLAEHGRWAEREVPSTTPRPGNPEFVLDRALTLPNAVCRLQGLTPTFTRCLVLCFRYSAVSDEKREGLIWLGFNLGTGAVLDEVITRLRMVVAQEPQWHVPEASSRLAAGPGWERKVLESRVRALLDYRLHLELEPFLSAMRRRLARDRDRVHGYYDDMRSASLKRAVALNSAAGEKAQELQRETLRVAAIEREYHAKLDDLRRNYALHVKVEWVQTLELYLAVQRFEVMIRRRKGERLIRIDWHGPVRMMEPPPCDWGMGLDRVRLVCDEKLHLTEPAGQAPCPSCNKPWCRACYRTSCPRCGR